MVACAADLIREQPETAILDSIIVRLDDPYFTAVTKLNHPFLLNRSTKQSVDSRLRNFDDDAHDSSMRPKARRILIL